MDATDKPFSPTTRPVKPLIDALAQVAEKESNYPTGSGQLLVQAANYLESDIPNIDTEIESQGRLPLHCDQPNQVK